MENSSAMKKEFCEYFILDHDLYAYHVWLTDCACTWKWQSKYLWVKWTLKEWLWKINYGLYSFWILMIMYMDMFCAQIMERNCIACVNIGLESKESSWHSRRDVKTSKENLEKDNFKDKWKMKSRVLKGTNTYPRQLIFANSMRSILRHGDIEWAVECYITTEETSFNVSYQPKDIKKSDAQA